METSKNSITPFWRLLLLKRSEVKKIKLTNYIAFIPTFSTKGEGVGTCVGTYALKERRLLGVPS
jgi:hypothetical protein